MIRSSIASEALLVLLLAFTSLPAYAQGSGDGALAQALFDDGRALMDKGRYAEACPKLAESFRLAPAGGSLLNVALCHEKQGKLATAWSNFRDALAMARTENKPERVTFATEHIEALAPRLNRLTIELAPGANVPGIAITHNGTPLSNAVMGTALPVDGGKHELTASAPGHRPWKTNVELKAEGEIETVVIPALERAADAAASPLGTEPTATSTEDAGSDEANSDGTTQRTIGYIVGGVGIVGVIVGAVFGVRTLTLQSEADDKCNDSTECPNTPDGMEGLAANEDAQSSAPLATAFIASGLGLIGAGLTIVLTAPSASEGEETARRARLSPMLGPDRAGATLRITW